MKDQISEFSPMKKYFICVYLSSHKVLLNAMVKISFRETIQRLVIIKKIPINKQRSENLISTKLINPENSDGSCAKFGNSVQ